MDFVKLLACIYWDYNVMKLKKIFFIKNFFLLECSWFTMLYEFQVYSSESIIQISTLFLYSFPI